MGVRLNTSTFKWSDIVPELRLASQEGPDSLYQRYRMETAVKDVSDGTQPPEFGKRPHIVIISISDQKRDPRVYRQVQHLSKENRITAVGFGDPDIPNVTFVKICLRKVQKTKLPLRVIMLLTRQYERYYHEKYDFSDFLLKAKEMDIDLIIANDNDSLPLAFMLNGGARIIHDAHEYSPREFEDNLYWKVFQQKRKEYNCRTYLPKCASISTVSKGIAEEYRRNYGVNPVVIESAPPFHDLKPSPVNEGSIRIIHHGLAAPGRNLESLVEMMPYLDHRFTLDLMLVCLKGNEDYFSKLKRKASQYASINFLDPVPMQELVSRTNQYDIGILIPRPVTFNLLHTLPNKFFEFIQARLAIAIGPSPEMATYVREYDCGIIAPDFEAKTMATHLNQLTSERITYFKQRADLAARQLTSESNMGILSDMIRRTLERNAQIRMKT